jgi:hypothetical protein
VSVPRGLLARLGRLNDTAVFLGVLVFALVGLFVPGVIGGALLLLMVLALGGFLAATWRESRGLATHALRIVVLLLFLVVAISKFL